ncbi:hypothetical protein HDU96_003219 [Phlyctochytrium bullatum]|nr:hypothetical protein HDU96_003219 [Phlyctochytrium bullatum]
MDSSWTKEEIKAGEFPSRASDYPIQWLMKLCINAKVLKFYGIKSLDIPKWEEEDASSPTTKQRQRIKERMAIGLSTVAEAAEINLGDDLDGMDLSDPLGLKPVILKSFDPSHFLKTVHATTSYADLQAGSKNLKVSIDKRTEVIKQLVKQHFAKFVNAKSTIDAFYDELKENNLTTSEEEGFVPFSAALEVLDRRAKAGRLRYALGVLEQWKFFFNLPSVLQEGIRKGNLDAAVRDYNKGKYLMESSFSNASSGTDGQNDDPAGGDSGQNLLPKNHRKVFEKVWAEVERTIQALKADLFSKLNMQSFGLEAQERVMTEDNDDKDDKDPQSIIQKRAYEIYGSLDEEIHLKRLGRLSLQDLKKALGSVHNKDYEKTFEARKFHEYEDWAFDSDPRGNTSVFNDLAEGSNKATHDDEFDAISADATQNIKLYYRFMKFHLRCIERVVTAPVSADLQGKSSFISSRGVSAIFLPGATDLIETTIAPSSFGKAGGGSSGMEPPPPSRAVSQALLERALTAFCEGTLAVLDGMEWLATRWKVIEEEDDEAWKAAERLQMQAHRKLDGSNFLLVDGEDDISRKNKGNISLLEKKRKAIDTNKIDSRTLVIISNLAYLRQIVIPKLVALIELKFKTSIMNEMNMLNETVDHLDYLLFNNYIRRKAVKISGLVRYGILYSGLDYNDLARIQEIRTYCYDVLMVFVVAHSEVSDASRRLIKRALSQLLQVLSQQLVKNYQEIDGFGVAGKLQAKLETEFLQRNLMGYMNAVSRETFQDIDHVLEEMSQPTEAPQELLDSYTDYLKQAQEATAMQFFCFRESFTRGDGDPGELQRD